MNTRIGLAAAGLSVLLASASLCAQATMPATATAPASAAAGEACPVPATGPGAMVSESVIAQMASLFTPPSERMSPEQLSSLLTERMKRVMENGQQVESQFPNAANLDRVRLYMLRAASFLALVEPSEAARQQVLGIAGRIKNSPAPIESKVSADFFLTRSSIGADRGEVSPDAPAQIEAFVASYRGGVGASAALQAGAVLAKTAGIDALSQKYMQELADKHNNPDARQFLHQVGYFDGKPFEATLTTLDGKTLTLPADYSGKVLVVDFWASWCPSCVMSMPYIKQIQAKYAVRGVEFLGISVDDKREELQNFIRAQNITWPQAFSGKGLDKDPTAQRYGVMAIPSVWVIGRDGRVVSSAASPLPQQDGPSTLELAIQRALASPATMPATTAPTTR